MAGFFWKQADFLKGYAKSMSKTGCTASFDGRSESTIGDSFVAWVIVVVPFYDMAGDGSDIVESWIKEFHHEIIPTFLFAFRNKYLDTKKSKILNTLHQILVAFQVVVFLRKQKYHLK